METPIDDPGIASYEAGAREGDALAPRIAIQALITVLANAVGDRFRTDIYDQAIVILDNTFGPGRDATFMLGVRQRGADVLKIMINPN
jgi:hypothetical protein